MRSIEAKKKGLYLTLSEGLSAGIAVNVLNEILKGAVPHGFKLKTAKKESLNLPTPLIGVLIAIFEGVSDLIRVYRIENRGKRSEIIRSNDLNKDKGSWVFLDAYELDCNEQALCIIGANKQ